MDELTALQEAVAAAAAGLAEAHGLVGGASRRAGDLVAAARAYDAGFEIESRYRLASHYNGLNRLVTRILLDPGCLGGPTPPRPSNELAAVEVPAELLAMRARLAEDALGRTGADLWTLGDLAVASALTGDRAGMRSALSRLNALSPPASLRERYSATAAALAALDTPQRSLLSDLADAVAGTAE